MENEKSEQKSQKKLISKELIIAGIVILLLVMLIFLGTRIPNIINRLHCGTNLSLLSMAMLVYNNDYNGFPIQEKWCDLLIEKCKIDPKTFRCPGTKDGPCNYALNKNIADLGTTADPNIVVFFETHPGWNQVGGPEILTTENHEGKGCNIVFLDSHVKFVEIKDIDKLKWKPD